MAKTKETTEEKGIVPKEKAVSTVSIPRDIRSVLRQPRISEKGAILADNNAYAFEVDPKASKADIAKAVKEVYKVTPKMVRVVTMPQKKVVSRGRKGVKKGGKKAYVFLKEGDKIEIM